MRTQRPTGRRLGSIFGQLRYLFLLAAAPAVLLGLVIGAPACSDGEHREEEPLSSG